MKVSPVSKSAPAPIPTAAEAAANPALVAPAPAVRPRRGAGALAGAGLLGSLLAPTASAAGFVLADDAPGSAAPAEAPATAVPASADEAEAAARAEAERAAIATVVAPILQKAMDEEGRGGFGCIAVDPPTILSESDALNLIEQEFAKAGVKLRDAYELTGFARTRTDWSAPRRADAPKEDNWAFLSGDGDPGRPQKTEPASWVFDLATEDGSILLEYLSTGDHGKLEDSQPGVWCSVSSYDFPRRAERFRSELETRTNGVPVTVGLFFDPMAAGGRWDSKTQRRIPAPGSALAALSEEERENLDWRKREELLRADALELLREQVRFFLDWARKEGKLPRAEGAESGSPAGGAGERSEPEGVPHAESAENAE